MKVRPVSGLWSCCRLRVSVACGGMARVMAVGNVFVGDR